ncbi:hypothetical protein SRB5_13460 [Streptomyces sp. RB5]|uniref:HTH marR-type domain-containing protein n=1 Tax=Streptomyces smaragdinus TaxID=2585196 RepID=A0A7K0CCP9_9ACTN|nr:MarR family winged helix-turn-helix transcriptional regulator [Streptomyces smaragdinus]MQY11231.1 hypothetical protein [Streptomyces smaragdinus]
MTSQQADAANQEVGAVLDDDFGFAIGTVFRAYAKAVESAVGDVPGGPRGYFILAAAVRGEAGSQRSLAERLGVDRTVMTYLLDDLEAADLVERRPDPADRRGRIIVATENGNRCWQELRARVDRVEQHLLNALPKKDAESFRSMLCTLAAHVTTGNPAADACEAATEWAAPAERPRRGRRSTA